MPDLIDVWAKKWKFIAGLTGAATLVALLAALLSPKEYLSTATALPANSAVADKARLFNPNIEALYSDFGTTDDLDRLEGTATLDTIFIATAKDHGLDRHYRLKPSGESLYKAALRLKKNSRISRSGYGELKIKVWDRDAHEAAALANDLLQKIEELHRHLQVESNALVLQQLMEDLVQKQKEYRAAADSVGRMGTENDLDLARKSTLLYQITEEQKMIGQYQLALKTNPSVLLTVEQARPALWPDRPDIAATVLFTFFGALVFSFLLALATGQRKTGA